jgi:hypothetical protein
MKSDPVSYLNSPSYIRKSTYHGLIFFLPVGLVWPYLIPFRQVQMSFCQRTDVRGLVAMEPCGFLSLPRRSTNRGKHKSGGLNGQEFGLSPTAVRGRISAQDISREQNGVLKCFNAWDIWLPGEDTTIISLKIILSVEGSVWNCQNKIKQIRHM